MPDEVTCEHLNYDWLKVALIPWSGCHNSLTPGVPQRYHSAERSSPQTRAPEPWTELQRDLKAGHILDLTTIEPGYNIGPDRRLVKCVCE